MRVITKMANASWPVEWLYSPSVLSITEYLSLCKRRQRIERWASNFDAWFPFCNRVICGKETWTLDSIRHCCLASGKPLMNLHRSRSRTRFSDKSRSQSRYKLVDTAALVKTAGNITGLGSEKVEAYWSDLCHIWNSTKVRFEGRSWRFVTMPTIKIGNPTGPGRILLPGRTVTSARSGTVSLYFTASLTAEIPLHSDTVKAYGWMETGRGTMRNTAFNSENGGQCDHGAGSSP